MTHKKIAELAHVSSSTVSKALSGSNEISPELTEKIRKIAIESGYYNEKSKRKRMYNDSLHIALIVPEVTSIHYSSVITYLKNEIEQKGGNISIYLFDFDKEKLNKLMKTVVLRATPDGIILFDSPEIDVKTKIPTTCITGHSSLSYDTVGVNMKEAINDAVKFLVTLGHTEIGFVGETNTASKLRNFRDALTRNNLPVNEDYIQVVNSRFEEIGLKAAKVFLENKNRPTAILTAYDEIAYGLVKEFSKNGVRIPEDISIMGINNISTADYVKIPLTTIDIFSKEQYRTAVEMLFDKILNGTTVVKHITIEHKIIERETTQKLNK